MSEPRNKSSYTKSKKQISNKSKIKEEEKEVSSDPKKDLLLANDVLITDVQLMTLFHLGYSSKTLTKSVVNSINLDDVIVTIKNYIETDELTIKFSGALLLGLIRVYEKKIKIFYDEIQTIFNIKAEKKKGKEKVSNETKKNKNDTVSDAIQFDFADALSYSNLNEGLFTILHKRTKPKIEFDQLRTGSSDPRVFIQNLNFVNSDKIQKEATTKLSEEEYKNVDNFYEFISDKGNYNENFDDNANLGEIEKSLKYGSDAKSNEMNKSVFDFEKIKQSMGINLQSKITKPTKHTKHHPKLEYDEDIEMDVEEKLKSFNGMKKSHLAVINEFKNELRIENESSVNFNINNPLQNIITDNLNKLEKSENKKISNEENLVNSFSNLNIRGLNFPTTDENLMQILVNDNVNFVNDDVEELERNDQQLEKNPAPYLDENEPNDFEILTEKIHSVLNQKGKKKGISFEDLSAKLKNECQPYDLFYYLLTLCQQGEIKLIQEGIFETIKISKYS
jgi:hypothetical protein